MLVLLAASVTLILCLTKTSSDLQFSSGIPLHHAAELERMIKTYIFPNKSDDETYLEYFEDHDIEIENDTLDVLEDLDISVLDADGLRNILKLDRLREREGNYRRVGKWEEETPMWDRKGITMLNLSIDLMKQSIYTTRYHIERTRYIRAMFRSELPYQMGVLYGYVLELRFKAKNVLATMMHFKHQTFKFARYLWLYERLVAIHVDFLDALQRMFMLQAELDKPTTPVPTTSTESGEEVT